MVSFSSTWRSAARRRKAFGLLAIILLLSARTPMLLAADDVLSPQDITATFEIMHAPLGRYTIKDVLSGVIEADFQPLNPPTNINRVGGEAWLKTTVPPFSSTAPFSILEIPGQIFNYIDVWFRRPGGRIEHHVAGDRYPYNNRSIKHASSAFPLPGDASGPVEVVIRARNETSHRMNFAAWVWPIDEWHSYLLNKRAWYGAFLGSMLVLSLYNLFLAVTLRDSSYLFYVGYILCLSACIVLLNGLAEEYIWPQGKPASLVLAFTGMGAFLAVGFVNKFLRIRARIPSLYWTSTAISALALIFGLTLVFTNRLPFVPGAFSVTIVHILLLVSGMYFVGISLVSYFSGVTQARFLALSMLVLLSCIFVYFSYTYGYIQYNRFVGHALEVGGLAEGILLSLALADRITILTREKQLAERAIIESQKAFSQQLINAREQERKTIAEALHDSIGHAVLVLRNQLLQVAGLSAQESGVATPESKRLLREQAALCGEIMTDVRRLSHDLHPHMLERLGLAAAIDSTLERALESADIKWHSQIDELPDNLSPQQEITIYRVIQEGLNNILKYSRATRVECRLAVARGMLHCTLSDNGVGFDLAANGRETLGLREMAGRVDLLGGRFREESTENHGTTIWFELPLVDNQNDAKTGNE